MTTPQLRVVLVFSPEDQAWIRRGAYTVPDFWQGHGVPPAMGDEFRLGGRQFTIQGRLWAQEGGVTLLRVFVGSAHAESDSVFG
ncbi:hypothetical protein J2W49_003938 [Hydrogenophaga palleronii]|uniref:Uncharacterized protein n=1 Tax=Hydrogenophaga palleronii TaxID=65655 RepID=A0ABU1WRN8_9BURK|nr:hypothetical protein [Hydrogenophaga palleronii]MDR7151962.1 hypothetical protein [Hydrogenophaga palleronii]